MRRLATLVVLFSIALLCLSSAFALIHSTGLKEYGPIDQSLEYSKYGPEPYTYYSAQITSISESKNDIILTVEYEVYSGHGNAIIYLILGVNNEPLHVIYNGIPGQRNRYTKRGVTGNKTVRIPKSKITEGSRINIVGVGRTSESYARQGYKEFVAYGTSERVLTLAIYDSGSNNSINEGIYLRNNFPENKNALVIDNLVGLQSNNISIVVENKTESEKKLSLDILNVNWKEYDKNKKGEIYNNNGKKWIIIMKDREDIVVQKSKEKDITFQVIPPPIGGELLITLILKDNLNNKINKKIRLKAIPVAEIKTEKLNNIEEKSPYFLIEIQNNASNRIRLKLDSENKNVVPEINIIEQLESLEVRPIKWKVNTNKNCKCKIELFVDVDFTYNAIYGGTKWEFVSDKEYQIKINPTRQDQLVSIDALQNYYDKFKKMENARKNYIASIELNKKNYGKMLPYKNAVNKFILEYKKFEISADLLYNSVNNLAEDKTLKNIKLLFKVIKDNNLNEVKKVFRNNLKENSFIFINNRVFNAYPYNVYDELKNPNLLNLSDDELKYLAALIKQINAIKYLFITSQTEDEYKKAQSYQTKLDNSNVPEPHRGFILMIDEYNRHPEKATIDLGLLGLSVFTGGAATLLAGGSSLILSNLGHIYIDDAYEDRRISSSTKELLHIGYSGLNLAIGLNNFFKNNNIQNTDSIRNLKKITTAIKSGKTIINISNRIIKISDIIDDKEKDFIQKGNLELIESMSSENEIVFKCNHGLIKIPIEKKGNIPKSPIYGEIKNIEMYYYRPDELLVSKKGNFLRISIINTGSYYTRYKVKWAIYKVDGNTSENYRNYKIKVKERFTKADDFIIDVEPDKEKSYGNIEILPYFNDFTCSEFELYIYLEGNKDPSLGTDWEKLDIYWVKFKIEKDLNGIGSKVVIDSKKRKNVNR